MLAIAVALGVSPMALIIPKAGKRFDTYHLAPAYPINLEMVMSWWSGAVDLSHHGDGDRFSIEARSDLEAAVMIKFPELVHIWISSTFTMAALGEPPEETVEVVMDISDALDGLRRRLWRSRSYRLEFARLHAWELLSPASLEALDTDDPQQWKRPS